MVNFKYILELSILSYLYKVSAGAGVCEFSITIEDNVKKITQTGCTSVGYYPVKFVESDDNVVAAAATDVTPTNVSSDKYEVITSTDEETFHKIIYYTKNGDNDVINVIDNPVPGYYKFAGKADNFIECGNEECKIIEKNNIMCDGNNIGKLVENGNGVCIGFTTYSNPKNAEIDKFKIVQFGSTKERYIVPFNKGTAFGFDKDYTHYALQVTENSITFDRTYKSEVDQCVDGNGYIINRLKDFCSSTSSGKYYNCDNGKCSTMWQDDYGIELKNAITNDCTISYDGADCKNTVTCSEKDDGYYYINDYDVLCKYTNSATSELVKIEKEKITDGIYWNGNQYNNAVTCVGQKCQKTTTIPYKGENYNDICNEINVGKIMDSGYNLVFCYDQGVILPVNELDGQDIYIEGSSIAGNPFDEKYEYHHIKKEGQSIILDKSVVSDGQYNCVDGRCTKKEPVVEDTTCNLKINVINDKKVVTVSNYCYNLNIEQFAKNYNGYIFVNAKGAYITNESSNGNLLKCEEIDDKVSCSVITVAANGYYVNPIAQKFDDEELNKSYPLIYCNENSLCNLYSTKTLTGSSLYYIVDSQKLLQCNSSECNEITDTGYYVSGLGENIKCSNSAKGFTCGVKKPIKILNECNCADESNVGSVCIDTDRQTLKVCDNVPTGPATKREEDTGLKEYNCVIGELYENEEKKLCVNGSSLVGDLISINNNNGGEYFIEANVLNEAANEGDYYLIKIDNSKIDIDKSLAMIKTYKYSGGDQKLDSNESICHPEDKIIIEFAVQKNSYIYNKIDDEDE